jgi:acyl-coenzyme A synthetase/AMP-(fatty) acid ligase
MGVKNIGECLRDAAPTAFIGIPKAHAARILLGWQRGQWRKLVSVGGYAPGTISLKKIRGNNSCAFDREPTVDSDIAAILFTSGSTGLPKGAVYTQGTFQAQIETLKNVYGIKPGEVDLCTFPLFALFAPALGMTAIIPEMDFTRPASVNPDAIYPVIEKFKVNNLFGSPALLKKLLNVNPGKLLSLHRVISAGAPVPYTVLRDFSTRLTDDAEIFTPYGATEALPVCSIGSHEILRETANKTRVGGGICVGKPVPGVSVAIMPISDEAVPTWNSSSALPVGEIGEIAASGPQVTKSYIYRDLATKMAKMVSLDGEIWHRMGDLGYKDEQGRIWFCGRKSHRVITAGGTYFTIPCEGVFNTHQDVARTALVAVSGRPVLCVEPARHLSGQEKVQLRAELRAIAGRFEHTKNIQEFLFHPSFPVDIRHNAKIFREKLQVWASQCLPTTR